MLRNRLSKLLSLSGEMMLPRIEEDIRKRLVLGGLVGAAAAFSNRRALGEPSTSGRAVVSSDGIIRTSLESYVNDAGEDFRLVLTTYPPSVGLPPHHHPSVAHNYVLEGVAESHYLGDELKRLAAGHSYQNKAATPHMIFRNGDRSAPLKYLIAYTVKKGQPFLIIP